MLEWVEKYENIDGRFHFFEAYTHFSSLYQQVGKRLLSMKSIGSMDMERTAKPFKHCILTKERSKLTIEKGIVLFRAGQNLKHLHHARKAIKGKVYEGVVGTEVCGGPSPDTSINSDCDLAEWYICQRFRVVENNKLILLYVSERDGHPIHHQFVLSWINIVSEHRACPTKHGFYLEVPKPKFSITSL
jgi:hypothetical protein